MENREWGVEWQVAMRPSRRRQLEPGSEEALGEKRKASVRAKVEHPFLYVKRHFGYAKVRYRGLAKNTQRLALSATHASRRTGATTSAFITATRNPCRVRVSSNRPVTSLVPVWVT